MKTVLVTGANKGIGFEVAKQLLERGFNVLLTARSAKRGLQAKDKLKDFGETVWFFQLDVEREESIINAAKEIERNNFRLDVIINNAAVLSNDEEINTASYNTILS